MDPAPRTSTPANGTAIARPAPAEQKALMLLDGQRVRVAVEGGYLTRIQRRIRLHHGTELYHPGKGRPGADDKVSPYQPGYMRLVSAMGGQLVCPPAVRDPVTGAMRPNPLVETSENGIIRRVTATAVCVVRNPATGEYHASIQSITVDAEHILREALLKIEREEIVAILSAEDIEADRAAGKLRGKLVIPLTPPYAYLVADASKPTVREALRTFQQQSGTIRQRACSKAERLAADHNPITRRTWLGSQLTWPKEGPPYAEIEVVAWVDHRGQAEMESFLEQLASQQHVEGVSTVVGMHDDASDDAGIDDDLDPGDRALPDRGETPDPLAGVRPAEREPVPVERPAEPRREPVNGQPQPKPNGSGGAKPVETSPAEVAALRVRADWLESHLPEEEVTGVRTSLLERRPTDRMDAAGLRRLIAALAPIAEDLGVSVPK